MPRILSAETSIVLIKCLLSIENNRILSIIRCEHLRCEHHNASFELRKIRFILKAGKIKSMTDNRKNERLSLITFAESEVFAAEIFEIKNIRKDDFI